MAMINPIVEQEFSDPADPFKQEAARLARRRALARSLIEQNASPAEQGGYQGGKVFMVGSPLGQVARSLAGNYLDSETNDAGKELQQRMAQAQADWQGTYNAATDPASKQAALVEGRNRGLRTDLEKSFYELDARQNEAEAARQLKALDLAEEKENNRLFLGQQAELNRQNRMDIAGQSNDLRRDLATGSNDLRREIAAQVNAKDSAAVAKEAAAERAKVDDANSVVSLLNLADPLIPAATSSGAGALIDKAGNMVGKSSKSADAAAQLRAIEGMLVSKMPKMSGPQSDKDVLLYKQMAGQIGDPTVPVSQKQAAAKTIREINSRYAGSQTSPAQPAAPRAAPQAALDALRANPSLRDQFKAKFGYLPEGY